MRNPSDPGDGYRFAQPILRGFPETVGAGPARDFARRARSYMGMARVGQRSGSYPRIAPEPPAIADKVRSYEEPRHLIFPPPTSLTLSGHPRGGRPIQLRKAQ
ncbi:hypothetical protein Pssp01_07070 [Pseudomonas sp. NBRC 100443]|nr:hypothetical protein Pssp01_07070 [Pseudomonas sp. NBRC 100443]